MAERRVAKHLLSLADRKGPGKKGVFMVSSRRHILGPGDILAVQMQSTPLTWEPLLIEVKSTDSGPYAHFPPADRTAMRNAGFEFNLQPVLAWVQGAKIFYIPEEDWPDDEPLVRKTNRPRTD